MNSVSAARAAHLARPRVLRGPQMPASRSLLRTGAQRYASNGGVTVRDALNQALAEEMDRDDRIFIMGEEVAQYNGAYKVTRGLLDKYGPQRVVDTPITEMGFAGLCVGSALAGLVPVCEFMTFNFAMQAIDQIINSAGKTHYMSGGNKPCNVVFRGPNGFAKGVAAQHSQDYTSWYGSIPGLKVLSPYSSEDAKGLLKAALRDPNPTVFLENELLYGETFPVPDDFESPDFVVPIGKAKIELEGSDVTLIAASYNVGHALQAAAKLKEEGISAEVINLRSIKPLDFESISRSIKKTHRAVAVESGYPSFGLGSEICGLVSDSDVWDYLDAPIVRVTGAEVPTPYAENLEKLAFPDAEVVVKAVKSIVY